MTEDFGDTMEAYLYADASAAIEVANREGLGRIRHVDTQSLCLQQALRKRRLGLGKVLGTENPSDLMTKHVNSKLLGEHVRSMGCEFVDGGAELAPQIVQEIEDVVNLVDDLSSGLMTRRQLSSWPPPKTSAQRNRRCVYYQGILVID